MSRTSLLSVTACAMCPSAAPTERDRALAGGAPTGRGYHVALHTPSVFGAPVDYHPTALLIGTGGEGRPVPGPRGLIPASRSYTPLEGHSGSRPPLTDGGAAAVINDAATWRAPAYLHISGERCSYLPWNPVPVTGHPVPATGHAAPVTGHPVPATGHPVPVTGHPVPVTGPLTPATATAPAPAAGPVQAGPGPGPRDAAVATGTPSGLWYAAGGALLLVIAGVVLVRRRAQH
ncbi:hypothetical protein G3I19_13410 [Streptomyces sp. SID10853]|uniref:hypothetical protein n=1 Tax=Streptomyces sp. SID10853 TaxID=2706028 RepID=UPI0013C28405|nr:hypothetical protein [Streptomyces sp. SID10853]NDZ79500.1 hypothetical protein [Streptomyces sp. SID10853]